MGATQGVSFVFLDLLDLALSFSLLFEAFSLVFVSLALDAALVFFDLFDVRLLVFVDVLF